MHKVIATKDGGKQVAMSSQEEVEIKAEWTRNQAKMNRDRQRDIIKERIPDPSVLAILQVKAQLGSDETERAEAQATLRAVLADQKELEAFDADR